MDIVLHKNGIKDLKPSLCIPVCISLIGISPYISVIIFLIENGLDIKAIISTLFILPCMMLVCMSWIVYIKAYKNYQDAIKTLKNQTDNL